MKHRRCWRRRRHRRPGRHLGYPDALRAGNGGNGGNAGNGGGGAIFIPRVRSRSKRSYSNEAVGGAGGNGGRGGTGMLCRGFTMADIIGGGTMRYHRLRQQPARNGANGQNGGNGGSGGYGGYGVTATAVGSISVAAR